MSQFGVVKVTEGNLKNNSLRLGEVLELFPNDAIGGPSWVQAAPRLLEINYGTGNPEFTDIARDKMIFRKRTEKGIGAFYKAHQLNPGDQVVIECTGQDRYHVYPRR